MTSNDVPDAATAAITAVLEDNPFAPPKRQAELIARELRQLGFRICAPTGRATTDAAGRSA